MVQGSTKAATVRIRHLVPAPLRRAAARLATAPRSAGTRMALAALARDARPIVLGPWVGEVGFELLYWVPFVRWFAEEYRLPPERLIAVTRGGAGSWYAPFAARAVDALTFLEPGDFLARNQARRDRLGEQKQIAWTPLDEEILALVKRKEGRDVAVLHPSVMYRLFAPYWWGHQPIGWIRRHTRYVRMQPPGIQIDLPEQYTAVKFYFNDCFGNTPENCAFVERTVRRLADEGPVVSLSTGVAVDDHGPCEPDIAAMAGIRHLLAPDTNLLVQSAVVARARRFVGTYGGFAYLAPLFGVPATSYYTDPDGFSVRHLNVVKSVLDAAGESHLLEVSSASDR
jgi:hypothetical protein